MALFVNDSLSRRIFKVNQNHRAAAKSLGRRTRLLAYEPSRASQGGLRRPHPDKPQKNLAVGIIGAGAAGLYAAIILDSLGIKYEILEGSERPGGRLFTHRFNQLCGPYQYFVSSCLPLCLMFLTSITRMPAPCASPISLLCRALSTLFARL